MHLFFIFPKLNLHPSQDQNFNMPKKVLSVDTEKSGNKNVSKRQHHYPTVGKKAAKGNLSVFNEL